MSGKSESAVSKAVMIKCPLVKLKGQKQLVFLLVRVCNGNTHKLRKRVRKRASMKDMDGQERELPALPTKGCKTLVTAFTQCLRTHLAEAHDAWLLSISQIPMMYF